VLLADWPLDTFTDVINGPKLATGVGPTEAFSPTYSYTTPDRLGRCNANISTTSPALDRVPGRFGTALPVDDTIWAGPYNCSPPVKPSDLLAPQQLTVTAWVQAPRSPGPSRYVLAKGSGLAGQCTPAAWGMYTSFAGDVNEGGLYFYVNHGGQAYHAPGVPASAVWDGNWHMVTGTFDGSTARFYLDDVQVGTGTAVPGAIDYSQPLQTFTIGGYGPAPANSGCAPINTNFIGSIDEVRIYDGVLDAGEVQRAADFGGSDPPPAIVPPTSSPAPPPPPPPASPPPPPASPPPPSPPPPPAPPAGPPTTSILLDPADPGQDGYYTDFVTVTVKATGRPPYETRCVLDPATPPKSFGDLPSNSCPFAAGGRVSANGTHTVYAASRDAAGNTEAPVVSRTFRISSVPDTVIDSGPSDVTWYQDNLFYFHSTDNPATFECRVDDGPFAPCSSPFDTGTLGSGQHTFAVRAIEALGGAVDPTPAEQTFTIGSPTDTRTPCEVRPVYNYLITGFARAQDDKFACVIGTPVKDPCPSWMICVAKTQKCPYGARCTITTTASWSDADKYFNVGAAVESAATTMRYVDDGFGLPGLTLAPTTSGSCLTGFDGDHCVATTSLQLLGSGQPLDSLCSINLGWPLFGYTVSTLGQIGATDGDDSSRLIDCNAEWRIEPAPELAAVAAGQLVSIDVLSAGILVALPTLGSTNADRALAGSSASAAKHAPRIAPVRKVVRHAGVVTIPLKLNAAARRLLTQDKQLKVSLRLRFTRKGGRKVTRIQVLTITAAQAQRHPCRVTRPKSLSRSTKLPSCLSRH
jgi:hypothetical protein